MLFPGVLKDKTLRQIARKIRSHTVDLGMELDLELDVIKTLQSEHKDTVDHAFYMLRVTSSLLYCITILQRLTSFSQKNGLIYFNLTENTSMFVVVNDVITVVISRRRGASKLRRSQKRFK